MPLVAYTMLESIEIISNVSFIFADHCIEGIKVNTEQCHQYFEQSPSLATALNPYLGYDKVAELVKESISSKKTIRELVLEKKLMSKKQIDTILDPKKLTRPNL